MPYSPTCSHSTQLFPRNSNSNGKYTCQDIVEIGQQQIQKPMKLSQIEKRIPQTLTNSKDIIQTDREYARRSSRARSTRGQENEAWALYKKIPSRESWGDLSGDRYLICPKPPSLAGKILDRRQLFFLANHNSPEQTPDTRLNLNGYKLKIIKPGQSAELKNKVEQKVDDD